MKVNEFFEYDNFVCVLVDMVEVGDICCFLGIDDVLVLVLVEYYFLIIG